MATDNSQPNKPDVTTAITDKPSFKGYSMSELRYQRALTALQMEFCKSKIYGNYDKVKKFRILPSPSSASSSWVAKFLTGLSYTDYALLGFSTFSTVRKIFKFFRKKK
ncbi:MAG: hypothetical protein K2J92_10235 [Muribaculaceae bacterium]|nr:hypothetical protein [Muribaculaceae bacterium]